MKMYKQYFIYHIRWQISAWVMMPIMYLLSDLAIWQAFCIAQFVGAIIFWQVDKWIFKETEKHIKHPSNDLVGRWIKGLTPEEQEIIWTKEKVLNRALEFEKLNNKLKDGGN